MPSVATTELDLTLSAEPGQVPLRHVLVVGTGSLAGMRAEQFLRAAGVPVTNVGTETRALAESLDNPHDLIVVGTTSSDLAASALITEIRSRGIHSPILTVGTNATSTDRAAALLAGADDYLNHPFHPAELHARLRALTRRPARTHDVLHVADLVIHRPARRAWRRDHELQLSRTEFDLLEVLARHAGIVLDPRTLHEQVWNYQFSPDSKNLAVFIGYLRRKTEHHHHRRLIHTIRGVGYSLR